MEIIILTEDELMQTIKEGEFPTSLLVKTEKTVIMMSQSWCPQFLIMRSMIKNLPQNQDLTVYLTVYDKKSYGKKVQKFKEDIFNNHLIPYLRFYKNGALYKETNYISKGAFLKFTDL